MTGNRLHIVLCTIVLVVISACANRGTGPQGGPKDTTPPKVTKTKPDNGTLQFSGNKIDLAFNEYILLNNPADNIIISPPQVHPPQITAYGKKIHILFQDSLLPNTTYTLDFGSAIQDNNENNPLENYAFSFSTGSSIDSLEIYGTVLDAQTLNPKKGIIVGIQSNLSDTAFSTLPFTRIDKTNEKGEFSIKNISHGSYRLFALNDLNHNYAYDPGEALAYSEEIITPYINIRNELDTVWRDTLIGDSLHHLPDSIYTAQYYYYEPSELLLLCFDEDKTQSYLVKTTREKPHYINLIFSRSQPELPALTFLHPDTTINYTLSHNAALDTITCWLKDSAIIATDSLQISLTYQKSDSAYNLYAQTDTLWTVFRKSKNKKKKLADNALTPYIGITSNIRGSLNLGDTLVLHTETPLVQLNRDLIHLRQKHDTVFKDLPFTLAAITADSMTYQVIFALRQQSEYKLTLDSAAFRDIYGRSNNKTDITFSSKAEEDYATLYITLAHSDDRAVLQLINDKDAVVRTERATAGKNTFRYLPAATYYLRLFIDENGDGEWTTGDWLKHSQPEQVFYLNKKLVLKANWEFEEMFDWTIVPLTEQKPKELIPDEKSK